MDKNKEYFSFVLMLEGLGAIFHYTCFIVCYVVSLEHIKNWEIKIYYKVLIYGDIIALYLPKISIFNY